MEIDDKVAAFLVSTARQAAEKLLTEGSLPSGPKEYPPLLGANAGAFVTINKLNGYGRELRGCIGFVYPDGPLIETLPRAAISTAIEDPRFPAVSKEELGGIVFEVSLLTAPEQITVSSPLELPMNIKVGTDGLSGM